LQQDEQGDQVSIIFLEFKKRLLLWLRTKPTGKASLELTVNEGGIRGLPKISITENL